MWKFCQAEFRKQASQPCRINMLFIVSVLLLGIVSGHIYKKLLVLKLLKSIITCTYVSLSPISPMMSSWFSPHRLAILYKDIQPFQVSSRKLSLLYIPGILCTFLWDSFFLLHNCDQISII